jgi:hypothetical protein
VLVGFAAAGKAGKASLLPAAGVCEREGVGDGLLEFEAEFDELAAAAGRRVNHPDDAAVLPPPYDVGSDGNATLELGPAALAAAVPQDLCWLIGLLELGAVELLSLSTLLVPMPDPRTPAAELAVGPGRDG